MFLNEDVSWPPADDSHRDAFKGREAQKVLVDPGLELCRLNDYPTLTRPGSSNVAPWWSPLDPYEDDPGFAERLKLAAVLDLDGTGTSIRQLSRIFTAIREDWGALNFLIKARVKKPVYGFYGQASGQARIGSGPSKADPKIEGQVQSSRLVGNAHQFYIPNLTIDHLSITGTQNL